MRTIAAAPIRVITGSALALALTQCARASASRHAATEELGPRYAAGPSYAFVNGNWLTRAGFTPRTFYSINGVLRSTAPARIDSTIDLAGAFVVPPFADAHTHNLDGPRGIDAVIDTYLREGTFYVQVLTNRRSNADQVRGRFNRPCTLDVLYANGGITGTRSHPFLAYEPRSLGLFQFHQWRARAADIWQSRLGEKDVYWFVDSLADIAAKWPDILAGRPDLMKIFLLDASETAAPPPADSTLQSGHGLKPSLVPELVRRAHTAGLRVAAHVETAKDFEVAVDAGVDLFAHVPGYGMALDADPARFAISDATARKAGSRGVVVVPTVSWIWLVQGSADSATVVARRRDVVRRNLETLMRHGVRIVAGSDRFGLTSSVEHAAQRQLGLWDNRALLDMWTSATAQSMFPRRRIGQLADGYEASFLAMRANPLTDSTAFGTITTRVKQGCVIAPPAAR
ncbi:MAG: amidohydrolase family protein [Gemmatimonadota bacterium]